MGRQVRDTCPLVGRASRLGLPGSCHAQRDLVIVSYEARLEDAVGGQGV